MVSIVTGATHKPMASRQLADFFESHTEWDGYLYIGYPIIGTADGPYPIDAMYLSRGKGLVIFNLVENADIENYEEKQDDSYNKMEAKLRNFKDLMYKRDLCIKISVITFAPALREAVEEDGYLICNGGKNRSDKKPCRPILFKLG